MKRVNVKNTTSASYAAVLRQIEKDKVCPFCKEHFLKYHTRPIISIGRHWILTENFKPYPGTKHHLLLVSKKHVTHFKDLPKGAYVELFTTLPAELQRRKIKGGGLFMRFGDTHYTFSSVGHLHAQLVSGVRGSKDTEALLVPLGFKRKNT